MGETVVDWEARRIELTAEAARLDRELEAVAVVRGRLVAEQAEGVPAADEQLAELHKMASELRERRADLASAIAVVRRRQDEQATAGTARYRGEMRGLLDQRLNERLEAAIGIDEVLLALEELVRRWRGLGRSASDIGHRSLGLDADVGILSDPQDEAALWEAVAKLAPTFAAMVELPRFQPGLDRSHLEQLVASEQRRAVTVRMRVAQAAEKGRQEAAEPEGLVILQRVA